jgi:hypothetical protein
LAIGTCIWIRCAGIAAVGARLLLNGVTSALIAMIAGKLIIAMEDHLRSQRRHIR